MKLGYEAEVRFSPGSFGLDVLDSLHRRPSIQMHEKGTDDTDAAANAFNAVNQDLRIRVAQGLAENRRGVW